jgi:hypothetical protein
MGNRIVHEKADSYRYEARRKRCMLDITDFGNPHSEEQNKYE